MTLKSTGKQYYFDGVWTTVHNLIIGRMWVDHYGDSCVTELGGSKRRVELKFKPCGWFSKVLLDAWIECRCVYSNI